MTYIDWGNAPDISFFYGRSKEISLLERWIFQDHCKAVMILGIRGVGKTRLSIKFTKGGVGKTDLSLRLAHGISDKFDFVVWRSLLNAPKFSDIAEDLIYVLSNKQEYILPENSEDQINGLVKHIQDNRCLVIFDNLESILEHKNGLVIYKKGYENYETFFQQICEKQHLSCLLLNGRELPRTMERMCGAKKPARLLELQGLDDEFGKQLVSEQESLFGSAEDWQQLIRFFNGNPLALEIAAKHIKAVYFGNIYEFLNGDEQIFSDIRELLDWHFNRLTDKEKEVLFWLAINREPLSLIKLKNNILASDSIEQIASTIQAFQRKLPLEKSNKQFTLQPVLMEYATDRFVKQIVAEIQAVKPSALNTYFLCSAESKDYIREVQSRLIVDPIILSLTNLYNQEQIENQLGLILEKARETPLRGYVSGNIINVFCKLNTNLKGYNFSGLRIRHAFLQEVNLYKSNFAYSEFFNTVFLSTLGTILVVSISPDGQTLAAGDNKGEIYLWRISDGTKLITFTGHTSWVRSVAFSADCKLLASCSSDYTVRIWNLPNGECTKILKGHSDQVYSVAFNKDNEILASGGEDQQVLLWDIQEGKIIQTINNINGRVRSVAFSPKENILAIASKNVSLWDIHNRKLIGVIPSKDKYIRQVCFNSEGNILAYIGDGTEITLWDVTLQSVISVIHHTKRLHSISFQPNGKFLATTGDDNLIQLWDIELKKIVGELKGHTASVKSIAFSPIEDVIVSGGDDQTIKIWDHSKRQVLRTIKGYGNALRGLAFSADNKYLISGGEDGIIRLWSLALKGNKPIKLFKGHNGTIQSIAVGPNKNLFVSGSNDGDIRIWNIETEQNIFLLSKHKDWIWSVAFSYDGEIVAAGSRDYTISLWDAQQGYCIRSFVGHKDEVHSVAFSPDSKILASGSDDNTIKLWDINTGAEIETLNGHSNCVRSIAFSPDGMTLVSGSDDQTIKLWDLTTISLIATLHGHSDRVRAVVFDETGSLVYSSSDDHTVKKWSVTSRECLFTYNGHNNAIWSLAYNPLKKIIASASEDETIRIWDSVRANNRVLRPFRPYEGMNIYKTSGITDAQKASLLRLGATNNYVRLKTSVANLKFKTSTKEKIKISAELILQSNNEKSTNITSNKKGFDKARIYEVALSFAGEDRKYVERVAQILHDKGINVFYDDFNKVELWGKNLIDHLGKVYSENSRFIVMFISKHYAEKAWTNQERKFAQDRAFRLQEDCVLPVRFDMTEIPGLPSSIGYIDLQNITTEELADLIEEKIKIS